MLSRLVEMLDEYMAILGILGLTAYAMFLNLEGTGDVMKIVIGGLIGYIGGAKVAARNGQ